MKIFLLLFTVLLFPEPSSAMTAESYEEARWNGSYKKLAAERFFKGRQSKAVKALQQSRKKRRAISDTLKMPDPWKIRNRQKRNARRPSVPFEVEETKTKSEISLLNRYRQAKAARRAAHKDAFDAANRQRRALRTELSRHAARAHRDENPAGRRLTPPHLLLARYRPADITLDPKIARVVRSTKERFVFWGPVFDNLKDHPRSITALVEWMVSNPENFHFRVAERLEKLTGEGILEEGPLTEELNRIEEGLDALLTDTPSEGT